MNDQLDKTNAYASWFESFLHDHPISSAFAIAFVASWVLTAFVKPWLSKGPNFARTVRSIDCVIAAAIASLLLHGQFGWRWITGLSLLIGGSSPFVYWLLAAGACWKWPGLRRYLSLRELAPESSPDDGNVNSGEGQ